jgi:hypothetical protein
MKDESIFIKCKCGGCSVLEINYDDILNDFNIAVWVSHPGERPLSKTERIRWCDHVMKTGKPWADHTIITILDAQRLAKFLDKYLSPTKYGKKKNKK